MNPTVVLPLQKSNLAPSVRRIYHEVTIPLVPAYQPPAADSVSLLAQENGHLILTESGKAILL